MESSQRFWTLIVSAAFLLLNIRPGFAQTPTLTVDVNNSTVYTNTTSGASPTIDLGMISTNRTVHVYDSTSNSTTLPTLSCGTFTITGSIQSGSGAQVLVIVADSTRATLPSLSTTPLAPGVVNFGLSGGGLVIDNNSGVGYTSLRDATTLVLAASGDLTGSINVARVFRVQTLEGNITSNITAHKPDASDSLNGYAISVVVAGNSISGNIVATGDGSFNPSNESTFATIGRIRVTGDDADGISGDIIADKGRIFQVFSSGPIDNENETTPLKIYAADGIEQIRSVDDADGLVERDIIADIQSGRDYIAGGTAATDGALGLLLTGGGVSGQIAAGNIALGPAQHCGIIARGPITADIHVDLSLENADIIGSSITGDVWIGVRTKGSIVATGVDGGDANAGLISSIEIGHSTTAPSSYDIRPRGMCGVDCGPFNVTSAEVWYNEPDSECYDGATQDAVIRAEEIGIINIKGMGQVTALPSSPKGFAPRIEAEIIGHLEIGDMRSGVIWSGMIEYDGSEVDNEEENDYAAITELSIGCVGPGADVWFHGCERA